MGGEWINVYVWPNPLAVHRQLSQHCLSISYTPKKAFFFFLSYILKKFAGDYPGSMVVKNLPSKGRMQVQPLVGELRSHTPQQEAPAPQRRHSTAKKKFLIKISK